MRGRVRSRQGENLDGRRIGIGALELMGHQISNRNTRKHLEHQFYILFSSYYIIPLQKLFYCFVVGVDTGLGFLPW